MITREEADKLLIEACDKDCSIPMFEHANGSIEYGVIREHEFVKFVQAIYSKAIEDAIDRITELGAIDREGVFAAEIRQLGETK